uniref:Hypothetical secreted protein n=1 Tax=Ornithodoros coriaceus TaxID=92741 RepID=B2D2E8_ORNCO|nr:hypothetical secreted protein precursor [Ornithodoros coriaceus]
MKFLFLLLLVVPILCAEEKSEDTGGFTDTIKSMAQKFSRIVKRSLDPMSMLTGGLKNTPLSGMAQMMG